MILLLKIIATIVLITLSALCSGLNIGLMSLNIGEIRRKAKLGDKAAQRVEPLRKNSNLSLASILISNVAVISATSLVLDSTVHSRSGVLNGIVAGLLSTILIVLFGEVFPQALFSRYALAFTSKFSSVLRVMIVITYPASKPLQLLLDKLLGSEITPLHSRRELGVLIGEHLNNSSSELDEDEVEIMQGALELSENKTSDIMTEIGRVYWLKPTTVIDADKIDEIKDIGRSRIPIFDEGLTKCYGLLLMKDLVDIDFDDEPKRVDSLALHPARILGSRTALDTLFRNFITSGTHLLPVEKDDRIVGIVTIEDLIEEIVGHEITDETDRRTKRD